MFEPTYINADASKGVVVMRCILQDRCTWASNLLATLEEHNLTTTDFIIESNMFNLELPSVVLILLAIEMLMCVVMVSISLILKSVKSRKISLI
jgi:hypothetical protein